MADSPSKKKKVYVAGPYTRGDVGLNVRHAIQWGDQIATEGMTPFIPHLSHFWHLIEPHHYAFWVDYDNEWLPLCDAVYRIEGESVGSDAEVELANKLGIPVFTDMDELIEWSKRGRS